MTDTKIKKLPKRNEINKKYKWNIEDIYANDNDWEKDFKSTQNLIPQISKYVGKVGQSSTNLLETLKLSERIQQMVDKLFVYAKMKRDEDNTNSVYQAFTDRAKSLCIQAYGNLSFVTPEIISIPEASLNKFLNENKELKIYRHFLDEIMREKEHILSANEEKILSLSEEIGMSSGEIFTMLNDADIKFPTIKDENDNEIELTKGNFISFMENSNRRVRKDAFNALYSSYSKTKNTLAATLASNVKSNIFYSTVRKYSSCLESSLFSDNVPISVYDNLIETISNHLHLMYRYLDLRKKILGVDTLHLYDIYTPLVKEMDKKYSYEEAVEFVKNGLKPLGDDYCKILSEGFDSGWIDVYENQGKTSGAYSWGTYGVHPFVLLNYQGKINDVFTIAHEMGHSMHTYYSNKNNPYVYSQYKIFVAEVASTVNESLLMQYLLHNTKNDTEKAYLVNHYLEQFRGTVFRQTMFAEFEKIIHEKAENGGALTPDLLCSIYHKLNVKYFGSNTFIDSDIDMEWARIPHFYSSFYVYKYATGFSAAASLSNQILQEGKPAIDKYINFLSSGSSDYPMELLKKAGVDLSSPKPIVDALNTFEKMLNMLEDLIG